MFRPRVIPVLLLSNEGLVKSVRFGSLTYVGEPMNAVKIFNDLEADEIVLLDIDATKEDRCISFDLVKKIGDESYIPFAVGGGIKTIQQIDSIIKNGAEKVIVGSAAVNNPEFIKEASENFGSQSIVVCLDVKRKEDNSLELYSRNGSLATGLDPVSFAKSMAQLGAGEIIVQAIDNDGMKNGYDINAIRSISSVIDIPVIALGGASNEADFVNVVTSGMASAAAAGSYFVFIGRKNAVMINYPGKNELHKLFRDLYLD